MSGKSEDILLVLNNVRYKKNNGQLYLSVKRVGWMMDNSETFTVNVEHTDIKNQKISPEGKPKVQLQLVLHDLNTHTFHFANPEGKEKQVAERDMVKEKLSCLMAQNKRQPPDELMEKKRLLEEHPQLKQLYLALVSQQIITPDQFWKEFAAHYKQSIGPKQDIGVSGAFLADIKPQTDGNNGKVQYNLTPEIMTSIFKTYPAVKKKHSDYVPTRMSESEFWTRFFQSHYYSAHTTSRSENVFSECAKYDDKEWVKDVNSIVSDPLYDLKDIYEDKPLSVDSDIKVAGAKAGSNHIHATMIKRFNQHSLNILKSQTTAERERYLDEQAAQNPNAVVNGEAQPDLNLTKPKRARLEEKLVYDDLEDVSKMETSQLTIHQRDRYLNGPVTSILNDPLDPSQMRAMQTDMINCIEEWSPNLHLAQPSDRAFLMLHQFSDGCKKGRSSSGVRTGEELPGDLHKELVEVYSGAGELLRHFWACFPARNQQLKDKLHRMHSTLCRYHEAKIHPFQEKAVRDYNCSSSILEHLIEMFQIAYNKYSNWKARNAR